MAYLQTWLICSSSLEPELGFEPVQIPQASDHTAQNDFMLHHEVHYRTNPAQFSRQGRF